MDLHHELMDHLDLQAPNPNTERIFCAVLFARRQGLSDAIADRTGPEETLALMGKFYQSLDLSDVEPRVVQANASGPSFGGDAPCFGVVGPSSDLKIHRHGGRVDFWIDSDRGTRIFADWKCAVMAFVLRESGDAEWANKSYATQRSAT